MSDFFTYNDDDEATDLKDIIKKVSTDAYHWNSASDIFQVNRSEADLRELADDFKDFKDEMLERMAKIEEQIVLVRPDQILEEDYKELAEAWKAYNDLAEKLKTFKALKDSA